ncbi:RagB/SusD family nutrient uptake outer membrane protein [Autumnicola psychrophila]|uniref:RagB/SusD family nutrient uptake outer membrane protein n=1 Tax=Autumnicola psychrophila TaxID=3075592 RepID=A0ABU3DQD6_9FLAO|nr:RagB/SusD family nutrient uptake outer membrane protein [Zunongwangia sp. F225]MDT0685922.1 RagB/SusD family nutrient uptake outer membrane protein [Zunongwangia sp. F225]
MKNYIVKLLAMVCCVTVISCEAYLDEDPIGLITQNQINTEPTAASITSSVNSTYQLLSSTLNIVGQWNWDDGTVTRNDFLLQDIASGDMQKKWNPDGDQAWMDEIAAFNFTSMNPGFNGIWSYNYEGISRANQAISTLNNEEVLSSVQMDAATKDRLLGEAYFLRAFYYFDLVNNFGGVPLLTEPLKDFADAYNVANRNSAEEVWAQINEDLQEAVSLLPAQKYSSSSEPWRVSLGAALAMQAKVALFQENWSEAINKVNELQAHNFYSLNDHYFDPFDVSNEYQENEVIFSYNHVSGVNPAKGNGLAALMGWGFVAPTDDFINAFEENDPRLGYTVQIDEQQPNKLLGSTDGNYKGNEDSPGNKVFIRYADVLLWKAEALIQTGEVEEGLQIVDQIRTRARNTQMVDGSSTPSDALPNYAGTGMSQAEALQALRHERRVELGFESQRFNDLKRWGIAEEILSDMGKNYKDFNNLYPIPQGEIDRSGGQIEQNTGY